METRAAWPVLELRQNGREISGRFPYRSTAVVSDRGRRRKERFEPRAFRFAVEDESREINLLAGHDFDRPLASKRAGTLELTDTADSLAFRATLPPDGDRPSWVNDAMLAVRGGLIRGVSPGFRVPPRDVVPNAERFEPEPGNPDVQVRVIGEAVLYELSLVTRPAYPATNVEARGAMLANAVDTLLGGAELAAAADAAGISESQLRRALRGFLEIIPEGEPTRRAALPTVWL